MINYHPVTPERWADLEKFFSSHGNPNYCWCTYWRLAGSEYSRMRSSERREVLKGLVEAGEAVGILAYQDGTPVGWCSIAPRGSYQRIERSRSIRRLDERRTWSIACFFLDRRVRGQGLSLGLVRAAVAYARSMGAQVVESYPVEPGMDALGNPSSEVTYRQMGFVSTFLKAGFQDVTPPGGGRRVMRIDLERPG